MKTKPREAHSGLCGLSRLGTLLLVAALVAGAGLGLVGWKLRAAKSQSLPRVALIEVDGSAVYNNPNHHFSLAVPEGWTVNASPAQGPSAMTLVSFQNPNNTGLNTLAVWKHPPTPGYSARKWAEEEVTIGARIGKKDGTVRPNSWADLVVGGRPAASLITDLTMDSERFTIYHVYVMTDTSSMKFRFMIPSTEFAVVRPVVDTMLASCQLN